MLRITFVEKPEPATLKVEGRLRGPWVGELERSWSDLSRRWPARSVVVDLTDVTSIDSEGNKLLRAMSREGARFQSGPLMKFILDQIERGLDGSDAMRKGG
jgi:anti-anti-sigma regulatory factor